ncbi:MAG TPA: serine hydrolase [Chitinophaga sp.]
MIYRLGLLAFLAVTQFASCSSRRFPDELKRRIQDTLAKHPGVFAVAFKDLATGEEILINEREMFHAASTMKVPVMIEVYKQAAAGKFALSDAIMIRNSFRSIVDSSEFTLDLNDDSEQGLYQQLGAKQPLSYLVYNMIIRSSNLATNMVIELVDARNVTQSMRDLGARDIRVLRGVEDDKAFEKGLNNTTTAYDLMLIFEKIAQGKAVDSTASREMIKILLDQQFNDVIPARLPKDVKVAHKTGEISGVRHDAGIVFLPDGRKYVLVLLSKQLKDVPAGVEVMAGVSEMIYSYMEEGK